MMGSVLGAPSTAISATCKICSLPRRIKVKCHDMDIKCHASPGMPVHRKFLCKQLLHDMVCKTWFQKSWQQVPAVHGKRSIVLHQLNACKNCLLRVSPEEAASIAELTGVCVQTKSVYMPLEEPITWRG